LPFATAVIDAFEDEESTSVTKIFVYVGVRLLIVCTLLLFLYVLMKLAQLIIGTNDTIVKVEEIIIVHEYDTEEEAAKAREEEEAKQRRQRQTPRGKKQKDQ
jgi:uncharacterized membrane protein